MSSPETPALIERKLKEDLAPVHLEILDESHLHAGHSGARGGGGHYAVTIVSAAFEGLPLMQRHRLVYRALAPEMSASIHALALRTLTPGEWKSDAAGVTSPS
ncbi:MAG TPA: BolA family protein [Candidatus Polarisedimenticolia bacterium]|jgi:BolA protein